MRIKLQIGKPFAGTIPKSSTEEMSAIFIPLWEPVSGVYDCLALLPDDKAFPFKWRSKLVGATAKEWRATMEKSELTQYKTKGLTELFEDNTIRDYLEQRR